MKKIVAINGSPRPMWNTGAFVGPVKTMICGNTLQVNDYDRYNGTMFDPEAKKARHEAVFPAEQQKAFALGAQMITDPWN